jgi:hypothetical protein
MTESEAEAPAGQSRSAPMPTVTTLLSALFSGMIGTATKGTPQDANIRQPRIIQPDSRKCRTFTTHDGTRGPQGRPTNPAKPPASIIDAIRSPENGRPHV